MVRNSNQVKSNKLAKIKKPFKSEKKVKKSK